MAVIDVVGEDVFVDGILAERAPNEEDAAPADELTHREEIHVDAAGRVVRREPVLVEGVLEHEVIEVRLMAREEDDRVVLLEPSDPLHHGFVVDELLVIAA